LQHLIFGIANVNSLIQQNDVMAIKITEECINCGACEPECPNNAIYEGGVEWAIADGTTIKGAFTLMDGSVVDSNQKFEPISVDTYYITPNKCTECQGFHEEPQCAAVCPVDCCVPDEMYQETVDQLIAKKEKMHI
jgi:ferredoxin